MSLKLKRDRTTLPGLLRLTLAWALSGFVASDKHAATILNAALARALRRKQPSEYLFEEHGVSLSPATLAKFAAVGGGPVFRKDGPFPLYKRTDLMPSRPSSGPFRSSSANSKPPETQNAAARTSRDGAEAFCPIPSKEIRP